MPTTKPAKPKVPPSDPRPPFKVGQTVIKVDRWGVNAPVEGTVIWVSAGSYRLMVEGETQAVWARKYELFDVSLRAEAMAIALARAEKQVLDKEISREISRVHAEYADDTKHVNAKIQAAQEALRKKAGISNF